MTSGRFLSVVGALALFVGACVGQDGGNSTGSGGATGTGGANSSGGSSGTGTGGTPGSAGTGGAVSGTGGQASGGRGGSGGSTATGGAGAGSGGASGGAGAAGTSGSGGSAGAGGSTATGGAGAGSGGASGGAGAGGRGGGRGGASTGGSSGTGGASTGGSSGTGGSAGGGGAGGSSAARPSKGCGIQDGAKTLTTGGSSVMSALPTSTRLKITSGGMSREYIIDIPANYDPTHPYRLIFSWHQAYGSDTGNANGLHPANDGPNFDAKNYAYFGLHREATAANEPAIFVAPGGIGNLPLGLQSRRCPLRRPARPRRREPVHRRQPGLYHGLQLRSDDELCADPRAPVEAARRCRDGSGQLQLHSADQCACAHRVHGDDRHERWHLSVGQRHDGREGLRPSARQGQWLHDSLREQHPDDDGRAARNSSATTSKGARRVIPSKCARSMARTPRRAWMTGPRPEMTA